MDWIWEKEGTVFFLTSSNQIYRVEGESAKVDPKATLPTSGFATLSTLSHVNQVQQLENGMQALATSGEGVIFINEKGERLFSINEDNGLCSNNVAHITYNKMGQLWGATDNGVFAISVPSLYSRFTQHEGTCWQIAQQGDHMLVASMDGIFRVSPNGSVKQLTTSSVLSLFVEEDGFYSGEMDGLYFNTPDGKHEKLNDIEKVVKMLKDQSGHLWLQTIYGKIPRRRISKRWPPW